MGVGKTVAMTFRVTPEFKRLLGQAAKLEHRSNTNMLEKLLRDHCVANGLAQLSDAASSPAPSSTTIQD